MNEGIEARLRQLRPGALPETLAHRLERPPPAPVRSTRPVLLAVSLVSAAALIVVAAWHQLQTDASPADRAEVHEVPPPRDVVPTAPAHSAPLAASLASAHTTEVTGVQPISIITDGSNRAWRMIEVNWIEEDTFVFSRHPNVVRTQDQYRTVVPVALTLD